MGSLAFASLAGEPAYAFLSVDTTGAHGRMIEFDSSGTRGSGEIDKQTVTTCSFNTDSAAITCLA